MYGPYTRRERKGLWEEVGASRGLFGGPWVVCEDLNTTSFISKKKNNNRLTRAMKDFSKFIEEMDLIDLPLSGGNFTWARGNRHEISSRLDRFLISSEWDEEFRNIKQSMLPRITSDHIPIELQCGNWEPNRSYFKFENWWPEVEGFNELVKNW